MKGHSLSRAARVAFIGVVVLVVATGTLWAQTAGVLDTSFGTNGKVTTSFPSQARGNGMVVQPDGRIVVAGSDGSGDFALVRYSSDGSLDTGFNSVGYSLLPFFGQSMTGTAITMDTNAGKPVIVGSAGTP